MPWKSMVTVAIPLLSTPTLKFAVQIQQNIYINYNSQYHNVVILCRIMAITTIYTTSVYYLQVGSALRLQPCTTRNKKSDVTRLDYGRKK